jgi:hypothetical protein
LIDCHQAPNVLRRRESALWRRAQGAEELTAHHASEAFKLRRSDPKSGIAEHTGALILASLFPIVLLWLFPRTTFADVEVHSGGVPKQQMNLKPTMKIKPSSYGEVTQSLA